MIELTSFEDGMPSRWRLTVTLPEEMLKALEKWAAQEYRSTSNLAASILITAIQEHQQQEQSPSSQDKRDASE
jgi:metal-responsive CopG/Arc/MetJ family transcriptional regulator